MMSVIKIFKFFEKKCELYNEGSPLIQGLVPRKNNNFIIQYSTKEVIPFLKLTIKIIAANH